MPVILTHKEYYIRFKKTYQILNDFKLLEMLVRIQPSYGTAK